MPEKIVNDTGRNWGSLSMGEKFLVGWRQLGIPDTQDEISLEYRFHPTRMWRWDAAFPKLRIGIDFQGFGRFNKKGGHQTQWGIRNDNEKANAAAALGWRVFKYESSMLTSVKLPMLIEEVVDSMSPPGSIFCKECGNIYVPEDYEGESDDEVSEGEEQEEVEQSE